MPAWLAFGLTAIALGVAFVVWRGSTRLKRAEFIRTYTLPRGLYDKLRKTRPELELKDCALIARGLRHFFLAYLNSGRKFVAMPSQAADDMWHEFILYTREYERFCRRAFGGFFHHSPAAVLGAAVQSNDGLKRAWWHACKEENINPLNATRLPLLFALDSKLNIANGFYYELDCKRVPTRGTLRTYCAGNFSSSTSGSGCGGGSSSSFDFSLGDAGGRSGCGGGGWGGGGD